METLETLFANAPHVPTFEQVFGTKEPRRLPTVCCITGLRIRKGDNGTRYALGNGYSIFASRKLSDQRKADLTALIPSAFAAATETPDKSARYATPVKPVKDTDNG